MSLKTVLAGLAPVTEIANQAINASVAGSAGALIARQVVVVGGAVLASKGVITQDQAEAAGGSLLTFGMLAYQLLSHIGGKKEKKALAASVLNQSAGQVPSPVSPFTGH